MLGKLSKILGGDALAQLSAPAQRVNEEGARCETLSQDAMRGRIKELKERAPQGNALTELLPEVFALVREAATRTLKQRHFDEQVTGGVALHEGMIAEMATGEGKTLVATLPATLNALSGKGAHIVTVNDYLAKRDAVWMGQIYSYLGLTVGVLVHEASFLYDPYFTEEKIKEQSSALGSFRVFEEFLRPVSRREAYEADVTYGTNHEFGFDYLRDNLQLSRFDLVQREHHYAIIDEVDSILIDEARTPLIISGISQESGETYTFFDKIARQFTRGADFEVDEKRRSVQLADAGLEKLAKILGYDPYKAGEMDAIHHLEEAMRANFLFQRDKDYVVKNGRVIIVDQFTGRLLHGNRWSGGLHQAVEAKEHVPVEPENKTLASVSLQNYFRKYKTIAGMTGTALTSAEEFHKVYNRETVRIPTHRPMVRKDLPDAIFTTQEAKWQAVVRKIRELHERGQPVLVGTLSIEQNEKLSRMLREAGVPHNVLNAKNHETEGATIAQAGKAGSVTVATNMAGRGVDIVLGGTPQDGNEAERIKAMGGLMVLGTERHESKRIDNQLKGRTGRQGDPGTTQLYISLEDDLIRVFGGDQLKGIVERFQLPPDEPIENALVTKLIDEAQAKVEGMNFDARKHVLEYDDVVNMQRDKVYQLRRDTLLGAAAPEEFVTGALEKFIAANPALDSENVLFTFNLQKAPENADALRAATREKLELLRERLGEQYEDFIRTTVVRIVDNLWSEHLDWLEGMREAVYLRAHGQKDPLTEFKRESFAAFRNFENLIDFNTLHFLSHVEVHRDEPAAPREKIGRNDPCPCGSGKKWKNCGALNTEEHQQLAQKKNS